MSCRSPLQVWCKCAAEGDVQCKPLSLQAAAVLGLLQHLPFTVQHIDRLGVQVDFLMSGLIVLKERVDATEALIAIDLDNRRNDLVAFDLVCSASTCQ